LKKTLFCLFAFVLVTVLPASAATPIPPAPTIPARSWILIDAASGQPLARHAADQPVEPASLTKLMTAYAVFDALRDGKLRLDTLVPISERAWRAEGSRTFLDLNSRVPVEVLLQGMIVQSGNDASIALAEAAAGSEDTFAALMNQYATQLGMRGSHFQNATGLPGPQHRVTAADMARLARAIVREFPEYYRWYSQREFTWNNIRQGNRNGLLDRDPSVDGMKTGMTDAAGYCLVSSARRDGMRLIAVVMGTAGASEREDASLALLNWGFSFHESRHLHAAGDKLADVRVYRARGGRAALGLREDLAVVLPRASTGTVEVRVEPAPKLFAPLTVQDQAGTVRVLLDGKPLTEAGLYPLADTPTGGFLRRLWDTILSWFA